MRCITDRWRISQTVPRPNTSKMKNDTQRSFVWCHDIRLSWIRWSIMQRNHFVLISNDWYLNQNERKKSPQCWQWADNYLEPDAFDKHQTNNNKRSLLCVLYSASESLQQEELSQGSRLFITRMAQSMCISISGRYYGKRMPLSCWDEPEIDETWLRWKLQQVNICCLWGMYCNSLEGSACFHGWRDMCIISLTFLIEWYQESGTANCTAMWECIKNHCLLMILGLSACFHYYHEWLGNRLPQLISPLTASSVQWLWKHQMRKSEN